jgi:hypothetical protein
MTMTQRIFLLAVLGGLALGTSAQPVVRRPAPSVGLDVFQLVRPGLQLVLPGHEVRQLRLEPYVRVPLGTEPWALIGSLGYNRFRRDSMTAGRSQDRVTGVFLKAGVEYLLSDILVLGASAFASRYRQELAFRQFNPFDQQLLTVVAPSRDNTTLGLEGSVLVHVPIGERLVTRWGAFGTLFTAPLRPDPVPYTFLPGVGRDPATWYGQARFQVRPTVQVFYTFQGRRPHRNSADDGTGSR